MVAFVVTAVVDVGVIDDDVDIVVFVVGDIVVVGCHWSSLVINDREACLSNPHTIFQVLLFASFRGRL